MGRSPVAEPVVADIFDYLRKTFKKRITPKTTKEDINRLISDRIREIDSVLRKKKMSKYRKEKLKIEKKRISKWPDGLFKKTNAWSRIKRNYLSKMFKQRRGKTVYVRSYQKWTKEEEQFILSRQRRGWSVEQIQRVFVKRYGYYRSEKSIQTKIYRLRRR